MSVNRKDDARILEVDHGSFTLLLITALGGMEEKQVNFALVYHSKLPKNVKCNT